MKFCIFILPALCLNHSGMFPSMWVCCVAGWLASDSFEVPRKAIIWKRRTF